jgi:adenosylcobyric acid synthase
MVKAIMFQGTGSGVGKSLLTAAFCRILHQNGVRVAPFKAQNMALNSFVTADGKEMGRAQVYQAEACGLMPDVRMNPILLKPTGEMCSQVILMGRPVANMSGRDYYVRHAEHLTVVRAAYDSLAQEFEVIVIEGAGSPAEINLQPRDLVNMQMAAYAKAPVILVGDIDRGGVFAWLKGTYDLIQDSYKHLVSGYLINKFRGDKGLLQPGIDQFRQLLHIECLGVLPWFQGITVDQEDGVHLNEAAQVREEAALKIAVIKLPRISNFTDFTPFVVDEDVSIYFTSNPELLLKSDCIILPGTKNTRADLQFLHETGLAKAIWQARRAKIPIWGICGGYQMLGVVVNDGLGIEGQPGVSQGLGLLDVETTMTPHKWLEQTEVQIQIHGLGLNCHVKGYEIHMGRTIAVNEVQGISPQRGVELGAMSEDGLVLGTYLHGLFENDEIRLAFLNMLRYKKGLLPRKKTRSYRAFKDGNLNKLADWMRDNVDIKRLLELLERGVRK